MIEVGLLWFDDNSKRSLENKIRDAAGRYEEKFGHAPDTCYINSDMLAQEQPQIGDMQVLVADNILPHHYWIGVQAPESG